MKEKKFVRKLRKQFEKNGITPTAITWGWKHTSLLRQILTGWMEIPGLDVIKALLEKPQCFAIVDGDLIKVQSNIRGTKLNLKHAKKWNKSEIGNVTRHGRKITFRFAEDKTFTFKMNKKTNYKEFPQLLGGQENV